MAGRDVIVIGASSGGVKALTELAHALPPGLPAAVFVVCHFPVTSFSRLPEILSRHGPLLAAHAQDGEPVLPGRIYVAPPDYHLLLKNGHVKLARGPTENSNRPAVDPLFRTAARRYGRRVVGVVLSGVLDDGTAGLQAIKERGGIAVVQDPEDALYSGMPENALNHVAVDHAVPAAALGPLLARLAAEPPPADDDPPPSQEMDMETDMAELELEAMQDFNRPGEPSGFACPECGGALWELRDGELIRYRCRVGHAFSPDTLLAEQSDALEAALWSALRALEERAALAHKMAERADRRGNALIAEKFRGQVSESEAHAGLIRKVILGRAAVNTESTSPETGEKPEAGAPPPPGA